MMNAGIFSRSFLESPEYALWSALLAGSAAVLAALLLVFVVDWRNLDLLTNDLLAHRLEESDGRVDLRTWLDTALVVIGFVAAALVIRAVASAGRVTPLEISVSDETSLAVYAITLLLWPCIRAWLRVRRIAATDALWCVPPEIARGHLSRLEGLSRKYFLILSAVLSVAVVNTGMRRRALIAVSESAAPPAESTLLYGLFYGILLALFFLLTQTALNRRVLGLLDEVAPLPDVRAVTDFKEKVEVRAVVRSEIEGTSSPGALESALVIVAPLLAAILDLVAG
jgi:hypothetical protein